MKFNQVAIVATVLKIEWLVQVAQQGVNYQFHIIVCVFLLFTLNPAVNRGSCKEIEKRRARVREREREREREKTLSKRDLAL